MPRSNPNIYLLSLLFDITIHIGTIKRLQHIKKAKNLKSLLSIIPAHIIANNANNSFVNNSNFPNRANICLLLLSTILNVPNDKTITSKTPTKLVFTLYGKRPQIRSMLRQNPPFLAQTSLSSNVCNTTDPKQKV